MRYAFDFDYLMILLLAGSAVAFMIWVFWNVSREIRGEVRTKASRPRATGEPESIADDENTKESAVVSAREREQSQKAVPENSRRPEAGTSERRLTLRIVR